MDKEIAAFYALKLLLENCIRELYVKECLESVLSGIVIYTNTSSNAFMEKSRVFEIYSHRFELQNKITNSMVEGYEELLKKIKSFKGSLIRIQSISTSELSFIIFSNEDLSELISILKTPYSTIESKQTMDQQNQTLVSRSLYFNKGQIVIN